MYFLQNQSMVVVVSVESCLLLCSDFGFMSLYHVLLCLVLIFHDPLCPLSFSYVLPSGSLCLQSCSLLVFSSVLLPLVTTPGLLPPLSLHLFLVGSSVSVYLVCELYFALFLLHFVQLFPGLWRLMLLGFLYSLGPFHKAGLVKTLSFPFHQGR